MPLTWAVFLNHDAAALLVAMMYGNDDALSGLVRQSFAIIGMQHVMAASGFNVSLILQVAHHLIGRFLPRRGWLFFSLLLILWYGVRLTWPASLVRASVMASWQLFARFGAKRPITVWWSLVLTYITTVLFWPSLLASVGWQLSFVATASLVLLSACSSTSHTHWLLDPFASQPVSQLHIKRSVVTLFAEGIATGLVVQLGTLPIMWRHFGEIAWMGIPANAALVWLTPVLTTIAVYVEVAAMLWQKVPFALYMISLLAIPLGWLTEIFLWGVHWFSQLPLNSSIHLPGELQNWHFAAWWLSWAVIAYWWQRRRNRV